MVNPTANNRVLKQYGSKFRALSRFGFVNWWRDNASPVSAVPASPVSEPLVGLVRLGVGFNNGDTVSLDYDVADWRILDG